MACRRRLQMALLSAVQMALLLLSAALTVSVIRGRNRGHKFLEPGYHEKLAAGVSVKWRRIQMAGRTVANYSELGQISTHD